MSVRRDSTGKTKTYPISQAFDLLGLLIDSAEELFRLHLKRFKRPIPVLIHLLFVGIVQVSEQARCETFAQGLQIFMGCLNPERCYAEKLHDLEVALCMLKRFIKHEFDEILAG